MKFQLTQISKNKKTGPIPVSITSQDSCPLSCPLRNGGGCYAEYGYLLWHWQKVKKDWDEFLAQVRAIPKRTLWRHNQAGDLPGDGTNVNATMLQQLTRANHGKYGFTFTHYTQGEANLAAIREANDGGFTINLSADSPAEADQLCDAAAGPVVVVLPKAYGRGTRKDGTWKESLPDYNRRRHELPDRTPGGRKITVCPASISDVSCRDCALCADPKRKEVIGFPAHGTGKNYIKEV